MSDTQESILKNSILNKKFIKYSRPSKALSKNKSGDIAYFQFDSQDMEIINYEGYAILAKASLINDINNDVIYKEIIKNIIYEINGKYVITFDPTLMNDQFLEFISAKIFFDKDSYVLNIFEKTLQGQASRVIANLKNNAKDYEGLVARFSKAITDTTRPFLEHDDPKQSLNNWINDTIFEYKKNISPEHKEYFNFIASDNLLNESSSFNKVIQANIDLSNTKNEIQYLENAINNKNVFNGRIKEFIDFTNDGLCINREVIFDIDSSGSAIVKFIADVKLPNPLINSKVKCDYGILTIEIKASIYRGDDQIIYDVSVKPKHKNVFVNGYYHPHINSSGSVCWGNMDKDFRSSCSSHNIGGIYLVISLVLQHYNAGSPYITAESFGEMYQNGDVDYDDDDEDDDYEQSV